MDVTVVPVAVVAGAGLLAAGAGGEEVLPWLRLKPIPATTAIAAAAAPDAIHVRRWACRTPVVARAG
ncbi:hypothetical protein [Kribbella qitaiheensis]|uniref:hypothetical protein n=1 Tax=Kribbella qitaiheensis TaxID=1544730 RepID=UPI001FECCF5C|nr:hypothetical protein [Kribbella qitaiheensis]